MKKGQYKSNGEIMLTATITLLGMTFFVGGIIVLFLSSIISSQIFGIDHEIVPYIVVAIVAILSTIYSVVFDINNNIEYLLENTD